MVVQEDGKWLVLPEWRFDSAVQLNNNTRTTSRASSDTMMVPSSTNTGSVNWLDGGLYWTSHCKPLDLTRPESNQGLLQVLPAAGWTLH